MNLDTFRSHFYSGSDFIHFNNAGQALIPDVTRDLATAWLQRFYNEGAFCSMEGWEQTEITRQKLAKFIGAKESEVSFFQTTASALSQVAFGIPLKPDDEILIWDQEYPSNFYPWRVAAEKSGAKLIQVESENWQTPAQKILDCVTTKTRVIAVSWVQFQTGSVTDLNMLSQALRGSGIWLVADVVQGVGVRPFHFHESGFDVVCGGSHKWLCSSYGASYMAIKQERMMELEPHEFGAMTFGTPDTEKSFSIQPKLDSKRYEPGSKSMIEVIAMGASLDLFTEFSIDNIFKESSRLGARLQSGLKELGFDVISDGPIVNFASNEALKLQSVMKKLEDAKISFAKRGPGVRLSLHAYNCNFEVDRVLNLLC